MSLTSCGFNSRSRFGQKVVRTVHATFGWGFFILLDGHIELLSKATF
jgi:hypothetical protein